MDWTRGQPQKQLDDTPPSGKAPYPCDTMPPPLDSEEMSGSLLSDDDRSLTYGMLDPAGLWLVAR